LASAVETRQRSASVVQMQTNLTKQTKTLQLLGKKETNFKKWESLKQLLDWVQQLNEYLKQLVSLNTYEELHKPKFGI
jgi:hypothetical protein